MKRETPGMPRSLWSGASALIPAQLEFLHGNIPHPSVFCGKSNILGDGFWTIIGLEKIVEIDYNYMLCHL
jgi:hypothetical protein